MPTEIVLHVRCGICIVPGQGFAVALDLGLGEERYLGTILYDTREEAQAAAERVTRRLMMLAPSSSSVHDIDDVELLS